MLMTTAVPVVVAVAGAVEVDPAAPAPPELAAEELEIAGKGGATLEAMSLSIRASNKRTIRADCTRSRPAWALRSCMSMLK